MKRTLLPIGYLFLLILTSFSIEQVGTRSLNTTNTYTSNGVTDKNRVKQDKVQKNSALKTCVDVVTQILLTSPTYLERTKGLNFAVVKNGGTSYGITLEGSPHFEKDNAQNYSKTYDFNLHETYPDRMTVIERFSFNPDDRQLYINDVIADKLIPIDFVRSLPLKFDEICK